jgi:hypothetical protein
VRGVCGVAQRSAPTLSLGGTVPTNSCLNGLPRAPQMKLLRLRRIYHRRLVMRTAIYVRVSTLTLGWSNFAGHDPLARISE